ncbi:uncharacterized protein LOC133343634 [Lethenteron reissneri]|uniref:uncharacterized protein LOC133343634 n=1 Tax=Lethenteron reissneri TaxID=7753 RepID=UPI002AB66B66|nr:uncharacterized protein LOC133343634 [Lethenteron reissneri]XP_061409323.1 uncharacterized protein LOC133343634 [Lethenteron reissneri]
MRDFNRQPSVTFKMVVFLISITLTESTCYVFGHYSCNDTWSLMHNVERKLNPCSAHDQVSDIPRYYLKENYASVPIDALIQWHSKLVNECKRFADLHLMIFSLNKSHDHMSHLMDFKDFKFEHYIENFTSLHGLTENLIPEKMDARNQSTMEFFRELLRLMKEATNFTNSEACYGNWSTICHIVPRLKERDTVNEEPDARGNEASSSESKSSVGIHAQTGTLVASLLFNVLLIGIVSKLWCTLRTSRAALSQSVNASEGRQNDQRTKLTIGGDRTVYHQTHDKCEFLLEPPLTEQC